MNDANRAQCSAGHSGCQAAKLAMVLISITHKEWSRLGPLRGILDKDTKKEYDHSRIDRWAHSIRMPDPCRDSTVRCTVMWDVEPLVLSQVHFKPCCHGHVQLSSSRTFLLPARVCQRKTLSPQHVRHPVRFWLHLQTTVSRAILDHRAPFLCPLLSASVNHKATQVQLGGR